MSRSITLLALSILALALAACLPLSASGVQPTPVDSLEQPQGDLRPLEVEHVAVEVGIGSPIPITVVASGTWPDQCAQLAETRQAVGDGLIDITLLATPAEADCPPDFVGLPFRVDVPLNAVDLPAGAYRVIVNGAAAAFDWQPGVTAPTVPVPNPAQVDSVNVVVEGGAAVKSAFAVVSGLLPDTCSQVGEVSVQRYETTFSIVVLAAAFETGQPCEAAGIPFELTVPLNLTHLPAAEYTVNANGLSATFDPRAVPAGN